jgi:hypothetical protein
MRRSFSPLCRIAVLVAIISVFSTASWSQGADPTGGAGVKAFGVYHGSGIEYVSLETSKLIVNIPLISYPQRGGKLHVDFALHWYNPQYTYTYVCNKFINPCLKTFAPVNPDTHLYSALEGVPYVTGTFVGGNSSIQNNTLWDSDGGGHQMGPLGSASGTVFRSIDATGFWLNGPQGSPSTVTDPNGVRFTYNTNNQTIAEDPNGNELTINGSANNVVDTLGRTVAFPPVAGGGTTTTDFTGCTGPLATSGASLWTLPGQNGGTVTFKFCFASVHIQINYFPPDCTTATLQCDEPNGNFGMLQSIVLPNGTAWEFEYNGGTNPNDSTVNAGLLSKITLPTGGTISYTWNTPPEHVATTTTSGPTYNVVVLSRTVDSQDGTGPHTWTYSGVAGAGTRALTITDPLGNNEVHTLSVLGQPQCTGFPAVYETQAQYYSGAVAQSNLLKTVNTNYSYSANPYSLCALANVVPTSVMTTWPNGQEL